MGLQWVREGGYELVKKFKKIKKKKSKDGYFLTILDTCRRTGKLPAQQL